MLAWSEELITDVRKPEIMKNVIVGGERLLITRDHRKLSMLNPKLKINRRRTLLSRWWDVTVKQLFERLLSEKSGRCGIVADYESVALYL